MVSLSSVRLLLFPVAVFKWIPCVHLQGLGHREFNSNEPELHIHSLLHVSSNEPATMKLMCLLYSNTSSDKVWRILRDVHTSAMPIVQNMMGRIPYHSNPVKIYLMSKCTGYILLVDGKESLKEIILEEKNVTVWNRRVNFLVISTSSISVEEQHQLAFVAWEFKILNVAVVSLGNSCSMKTEDTQPMSFRLITYNPLSEIFNCVIHHNDISSVRNIFEDKCSNFYGYPIVTSHFKMLPYLDTQTVNSSHVKYLGTGGKTFETLAKHMNFTPNHKIHYTWMNFGKPLPNGSWDGVMGDIVSDRVHMSINSAFHVITYPQEVDFTSALGVEQCSFVVPVIEAPPIWTAIFRAFRKLTWLVTIAAFLTCCFFLWFYQAAKKQIQQAERELNPLLYMYQMFLSQAVKTPNTTLMRFIFSLTLIFLLVTSNAYQASFFKMFSVKKKPTQMDTIAEVDESLMNSLAVSKATQSFLNNPDNKHLYSIYKRTKLLQESDISLVLDEIVKTKNLVMCQSRGTIEYQFRLPKYSSLHIVKEPISVLKIGLPVAKKFPCLCKLNDLINDLVASGLVKKWYQDAVYGHKTKATVTPSTLSLYHLQGSFYFLMGGLIISSLAFCCEHFCKWNNIFVNI